MSSWAVIYEKPTEEASFFTKFFKDATRNTDVTKQEALEWLANWTPPEGLDGGRKFICRITHVQEIK